MAAVALVILVLPAFRGVPYFFPIISQPTNGAFARVAAPGDGLVAVQPIDDSDPRGFFDPTIPARMLFSDHRGLFLWTPLAAAAAIGFALALQARRGREREQRWFLVSLLAAALALLLVHVFWPRWDGGFAFSQRFLTGLFPLYLIGVAELVRRARSAVYPALALAVAFSVTIAFVHDIGYDGISERDSVSHVADVSYRDRDNLRLKLQDDAKARWVYLWGLLHGRDSLCLNEPLGTTEC